MASTTQQRLVGGAVTPRPADGRGAWHESGTGRRVRPLAGRPRSAAPAHLSYGPGRADAGRQPKFTSLQMKYVWSMCEACQIV